MNLGMLIKQLELFDPRESVEFDLGHVAPTTLDSWRGRYEELALGYDFTHCTVGDLLVNCRAAVNTDFQGYKGGTFRMSEKTPVCVDNPGEYTNTMLIGVTEQWSNAILLTAKVSD